ncbi:MAG: hypothetical protein JRG86_11510 [Deltaproteobacteria bacterium]|nr:hypothetical protein [Deltaproteobacteria bacterium]MBW2496348.1 hypothetical protein [Deltaproteobacteria bacterium]
MGAKLAFESELRIAGNQAAFAFRLEAKQPNATLSVCPIDVMVFDDEGKVASMRAFFGLPIRTSSRGHEGTDGTHGRAPASRRSRWARVMDETIFKGGRKP